MTMGPDRILNRRNLVRAGAAVAAGILADAISHRSLRAQDDRRILLPLAQTSHESPPAPVPVGCFNNALLKGYECYSIPSYISPDYNPNPIISNMYETSDTTQTVLNIPLSELENDRPFAIFPIGRNRALQTVAWLKGHIRPGTVLPSNLYPESSQSVKTLSNPNVREAAQVYTFPNQYVALMVGYTPRDQENPAFTSAVKPDLRLNPTADGSFLIGADGLFTDIPGQCYTNFSPDKWSVTWYNGVRPYDGATTRGQLIEHVLRFPQHPSNLSRAPFLI
jgi:hypothetical protein